MKGSLATEGGIIMTIDDHVADDDDNKAFSESKEVLKRKSYVFLSSSLPQAEHPFTCPLLSLRQAEYQQKPPTKTLCHLLLLQMDHRK